MKNYIYIYIYSKNYIYIYTYSFFFYFIFFKKFLYKKSFVKKVGKVGEFGFTLHHHYHIVLPYFHQIHNQIMILFAYQYELW